MPPNTWSTIGSGTGSRKPGVQATHDVYKVEKTVATDADKATLEADNLIRD